MSSPGERSNSAAQTSSGAEGVSAAQPAPNFSTPIASELSKGYEHLERKIRAALSTSNIEKNRLEREINRGISRLTRGTPAEIRSFPLVSSQIARERGISLMLLEEELFAFASNNVDVKSTPSEIAFIVGRVSEALTNKREGFRNWTPNIFKKSVLDGDNKKVEPLAKLPAQNGQAAILACCERFLVAVERRPRARLS